MISRYPNWSAEVVDVDVRPACMREDDSLYVDDDSTVVVKAEACEMRRVFRRSATPYLGATEYIVLSDSDSSDTETSSLNLSNEVIPGKPSASTFIFNNKY